jgi:uncharacterized protein YqfA (UPF0365 family)
VGSVGCGVLDVLVGLRLGRVRPERWVEPVAVSTERFVGATAEDALGNHFAAAAVVVAYGALSLQLSRNPNRLQISVYIHPRVNQAAPLQPD